MRGEALEIAFKDAAGARFKALEIAQLSVQSGSMLAITGPSGSGKTTLLYALAGLVETLAGKVIWGETDILKLAISRRNAWRRENLGFVFQDFHLLPELSPFENVLLPGRFANFIAPEALRRRARQLLEQFGVPSSRANSGQLSRGEQQRVAMARALLFDPPIILADEPTASLDEASAEIVIGNLCSLAMEAGKTVLCVSHDGTLIERCSTRLRLDHGRILNGAAA